MIKVNAVEGAKALNHSVVDIHQFASRVSPTDNSSHSFISMKHVIVQCANEARLSNLVNLFCLIPDFKFALLTMLDYDLVMALEPRFQRRLLSPDWTNVDWNELDKTSRLSF